MVPLWTKATIRERGRSHCGVALVDESCMKPRARTLQPPSRERGRLQTIPSGASVDCRMESRRAHELENFMSRVSTSFHHNALDGRFQYCSGKSLKLRGDFGRLPRGS